jgi:hypothetical protein
MTTKIPTPEAIVNHGWQYKESCRCGGVLKYKYTHPDKPGLMLEWWVKYFQFRVMDGRKIARPVDKIVNLEKVLSGL